MRAVGYFVEGARRNGVKRAIGEQNRAFLDFCGRQGYEVAGTFLDTEGAGASSSGFQQMIQFLRREDRGFMVVVVDGLGVLGSDLGRAAMKMLTIEATGATVVSAMTGREAARELVDTWADRGDGTPVSERVRTAMRRKAVRGEVLGRPPFGYRVGPRRRLELVPEEAQVVRYIFRLYLQEGMGVRKIAGQLNQEDVKTRRGGAWSMVSIRDLLRNRAYLGTYSRFGVKVPGSHPSLVTPEDFRRVQDRLQTRTPALRARTVSPFLLSGLVYCALCGSRMIGVTRRQRWKTKAGEEHTGSYRYYQCESRTNRSACEYNTQRAAEFETKVREHLCEESPAVSRIRRAGNVDAYLLDVMGTVERIEGRMKRNRRQLEEIVADAAHGHITIERMRALGSVVAAEEQGLEGELAEARARLAAEQSDAERRRRLAEARERLVNEWDALEFAELQGLLRTVVDRVDVDGDAVRLFLRL